MRNNLAITILAMCVLTVAAGFVEGRFSNRWGKPADLVAAGERLADVPERVGDWQLQSADSFDEDVVRMLQCTGNFTRVYRNARTGAVVSVALHVGPPGPTVAHTPEICYSSKGQSISEPTTAIHSRPQSRPDETLWQLAFRSKDVEETKMHVVYGWTGPDGQWRAATDPRFEYGGQPLLYKLQLAGRVPDSLNDPQDDPCRQFLQDFLPALEKTLFTQSP